MREVAAKRQKLAHEMFQMPKLTMREGIVRVLEQKIETTTMKQLDNHYDTGNISSDDEL